MFVYSQTVIGCCAILNKVIDPIRETMPSASWPELIAKCYSEQVDLSAKFMYVISCRFNASLSGSSSVLIGLFRYIKIQPDSEAVRTKGLIT